MNYTNFLSYYLAQIMGSIIISGRHYLNMSADDSQSVFDGKEKKESVMECNDVQGDIILGLSSLAVNA